MIAIGHIVPTAWMIGHHIRQTIHLLLADEIFCDARLAECTAPLYLAALRKWWRPRAPELAPPWSLDAVRTRAPDLHRG